MTFWLLFILTVFLCLGEFNIGGHWNRPLMQRLGISIIVLIAVLRFDVGFDYFSYYEDIIYNSYDRYEPLSWLIFHFAYTIKYPPIAFIIIGCLTYYFALSTIWNFTKNKFIGIMVYVCIFYLTSLGYMRQALAVSITFWGIRYIYHKSFIKYLLTCIFATMFHYSALLGIIIYPVYRIISPKITIIALICIYFISEFVLLYFANIGFYAGTANALLLNEVDPAAGGGRYVRLAMVMIILLVYLVNHIKKIGLDMKLLAIPTLGILFPFILGPHHGMRIGEYFFIYLCLILPEISSTFSVKTRTVAVILLICYFLILVGVGRNNVRPSFLPYQTIFTIKDPMKPILRWPE